MSNTPKPIPEELTEAAAVLRAAITQFGPVTVVDALMALINSPESATLFPSLASRPPATKQYLEGDMRSVARYLGALSPPDEEEDEDEHKGLPPETGTLSKKLQKKAW